MIRFRVRHGYIGKKEYEYKVVEIHFLPLKAYPIFILLTAKKLIGMPRAISQFKEPYWTGTQWVDIGDIPL
jgi:hypothetical protein